MGTAVAVPSAGFFVYPSSNPKGLGFADMNDPFCVLFVCTANICRSPAAEYIARQKFGEGEILFRSAGFLFEGHPINDKMAETLAEIGVDHATDHVSHIVDDETLEAADLILTMEARHLRDLTIRDRDLFDKMVPLREAATLLDGPTYTSELLDRLSEREASSYFDERWDVEDPYKRSSRKYREAVTSIQGLVNDVFSNLKVD